MANKGAKSKSAWIAWDERRGKPPYGKGTRAAGFAPCLFAARDPLDFGADKALHDARQIVVEPSLEHGTQHFAGKANDDVAVLDKPAGEKCVKGGADRTAGGG